MAKIILEDYEINRDTIALQPANHTDYYTIVIEPDQIFYVKQTPLQLIKAACLEGGAGYNGRREAVIHQTGKKAKSLFLSVQERISMPSRPTHLTISNVAGSSITT
jgi:competence protein ComK